LSIGLLVIVTELLLQYAVKTTHLLLFSQLNRIIREAGTTLAMLARHILCTTLGFERTYAALEEKVSAFSS
jgi:hypothetical protein